MNKTTKIIPWFEKEKKFFENSLNHHAYIFEGVEGIGKTVFILEIAKGVLCNSLPNAKACNKCQSCRLFDELNHPDFYLINLEDDKKQISINQIRELQEPLYESSFLGSNKVFIINPLERMTREAFDSFLKNLEEPPDNSIFLLISHRYQSLPLTLKSRAIKVKMNQPNNAQTKKWLNNQIENKSRIESALLFSKGKPLVAAEMVNIKIEDLRLNFIKDISELIKTGNNLLEVSEKWSKDRITMLLKLEWMSDLLMDCLRHKFLPEAKLTFQDSDRISHYLSQNFESDNFFLLLEKTNSCWTLFNSDTTLRSDYQLQSLLVEWIESVGLAR